MAGFFDGLGDAANGLWCSVKDNAGQIWDALLGSQYGLNWTPDQFKNYASRSRCNEPPGPDDTETPDSCWPKLYRIDYTVFYSDIDGNFPQDLSLTSFIEVTGPIRRYEWRFTGVNGRGPAGVYCVHGDAGGPNAVAETQMFGTGNPDLGRFKLVINAVTDRTPSTPCGAPPSSTPPLYNPRNWSGTFNYTFNYNSGPNITIPVAFFFGFVKVDFDGKLVVPVNFNFTGNLNIDPTLDFNVDINIPVGGGPPEVGPFLPPSSDPITPPTIPQPRPDDFEPFPTPPAQPPDTPEGEEAEPPDQEEVCIIRAVVVTTTGIEAGVPVSIIGQNANPDIYAPSLGYVQFCYDIGNGATAWSEDIPVKNRRQLIPCEWKAGAIDVRGTSRPGVTWSLAPIWECTPI